MPTENYREALRDFGYEFGIKFDIDAYQTGYQKIKATSPLVYDKDSAEERLDYYTNTLQAALMLYMESKTSMGDGQYYDMFKVSDTSVIAIGEFILAFENVMKEKYASDLAEGKETMQGRKPFEGEDFGKLSRDMLKRVSEKYDKSLHEIWADNVINDEAVMQNMKELTEKATDAIDLAIRTERKAGEMNFRNNPGGVRTIITAKKTMEKVRAQRGFWWKVAPWHWRRNWREREYLNSLNSKLAEYAQSSLTPEVVESLMEADELSILYGVSDELEKVIQNQATAKESPAVVAEEKIEVEKITDAVSAKQLLTNKKFTETLTNEAFAMIDLSKVNSPILKNVEMKKNWLEIYYRGFAAALNTMWENFDKAVHPDDKEKAVSDGAINLFRNIYKDLSMLQLSSNKDRFVIAQNVADMIMKKHSPAAIDEKYAKYAKGYGIQDLQPTEFVSNTVTVGSKTYKDHIAINAQYINEARTELGLPTFEEEEKQSGEIIDNFVDDLFGIARDDIAKDQKQLEEERKLKEEAQEKFEKEQRNLEKTKDDKKPAPEKEKISVDLTKIEAEASKPDTTKVEAPKVEASNSDREKIVIEELSNDTKTKDVSAKVEVNDVPVASNEKKFN